MITNLSYRQNINSRAAEKAARYLRCKEFNPGRKAANEMLFKQGKTLDCYLIAAIKSTMLALNRYANKTGKHCFDGRNWIKKLVTLKNNELHKDIVDAEVFFPPNYKVRVYTEFTDKDNLSQGNKRVQFLECAYGHLSKALDKERANNKDIYDISKSLKEGRGFLAMRDITGLKSSCLTQSFPATTEQRELFKERTMKLFNAFKEHPENLSITLDTKGGTSFSRAAHAYSLKEVVEDGLIIINPRSKTNKEIKISLEDFYKYFEYVDFSRIQPEKMFEILEKTQKSTPIKLDHIFLESSLGNAPVKPARSILNPKTRDGVYLEV